MGLKLSLSQMEEIIAEELSPEILVSHLIPEWQDTRRSSRACCQLKHPWTRSSKPVEFMVQVVAPAAFEGACRKKHTGLSSKAAGKADRFSGDWAERNLDPGGEPFVGREFCDDDSIIKNSAAFPQMRLSLSQYLYELDDSNNSSICFDHATFHDWVYHKCSSVGLEEQCTVGVVHPFLQQNAGQRDDNNVSRGSALDALFSRLSDFKIVDASSDNKGLLEKLLLAVCQFSDKDVSEDSSENIMGGAHQMDGLSAGPLSNDKSDLVGLCREASFQLEPACQLQGTEHPNVIPVSLAVRGSCALFLVCPSTPYTLSDTLRFSFEALGDDIRKRLLLFQLCSAVAWLHDQGITHGSLRTSNMLLLEDLWLWLTGMQDRCHAAISPSIMVSLDSAGSPISKSSEVVDQCRSDFRPSISAAKSAESSSDSPKSVGNTKEGMGSDGSREPVGDEQEVGFGEEGQRGEEKGGREDEGKCSVMLLGSLLDEFCRSRSASQCSGTAPPNVNTTCQNRRGGEGSTDHILSVDESQLDGVDWPKAVQSWQRGELSNYDYLLLLNCLAGRRWGDRCFHTVMPWVIDMSVKPGMGEGTAGWRDLTKSKWRLAKGDEQLDITYLSPETPHHVSDECLSELAVCIYKARRLPLWILKQQVRSVYEPNEYPSSMVRLYEWTPDECIPEFFTDTEIFISRHEGMSNLAVPKWTSDYADFISLHRAALESDYVSSHLHHWIDLTFGYQLSGEAAIAAKNVALQVPSSSSVLHSSGRCQLFFQPHPKRRRSKPAPADSIGAISHPFSSGCFPRVKWQAGSEGNMRDLGGNVHETCTTCARHNHGGSGGDDGSDEDILPYTANEAIQLKQDPFG